MQPRSLTHWVEFYLGRGWSIIPVRAGDKRPLISWERYQHRPAEVEEARAWFNRWPDANVGIVTGAVSQLLVVDIDPRHGGVDGLARLERHHGPLPFTVEAVTGGGGRHLYFRHPGPDDVHNSVGLWPGLDLRGDGGYVVAPPSRHATGGRYSWQLEREPWRAAPLPMPAWLLEALSQRPAVTTGQPLTYWRNMASQGVAQGSRNNTLASFAGHLLWHGVDAEVVCELLMCWNRLRCRPPLPDGEVTRTVASIARLHERGALSPPLLRRVR